MSEISGLSFRAALELLKQGKRVCREEWNIKGREEWIALTPGSMFPAALARPGAARQLAATLDDPGLSIEILPRIDRATAGRMLWVGWTPTTEDLFAEDWEVLP